MTRINYTFRFERAIEFGKAKHGDSLDDNGVNYFDAHPCVVTDLLSHVTDDEDILIAGLLHDTIEDTDCTYEEIADAFGSRVADLVNEVTHEGKKDNKGYYFPRLDTRDAILIKFADRLSNISRMQSWPKGRRAQYLKKSKFWRSEV